jgi:putative FmdB family regulatory protein
MRHASPARLIAALSRTPTMPTYDYLCPNGHRFEVIHSVTADGPTICPVCGASPVRKAFAPPTIHFRGSGWAKKDRGTASRKAAREASTAGSGSDGGGDKAAKSESSKESSKVDSSSGGSGGSSDGGGSSSDGAGSSSTSHGASSSTGHGGSSSGGSGGSGSSQAAD